MTRPEKPTPETITGRKSECERNVADFRRGKNVNNEWYYRGYKEALEWVLTGRQP